MIKLSIIIVNYNVKYFLEQAVLSAIKACANIPAEIIIVDNNSSDGSVSFIHQKFIDLQNSHTPVHLIANQENTGFSKANNQGIAIAKGEYILLLNPDTVVQEDTFEKCLAYMDAHPKAGGMGVKMIDGKGAFLAESKRAFPSPEVAFYKAFGLANLFPDSKVFGKYHLGYLSENENHEVDVLAGAYMLIRKRVLEEIGYLDETFFMYGEDIDLSYRIVKKGYTNIYFADTSIIHYKGESTKKASFNYVKMFYTAMKIFAQKHFSGPRAGLFVLFLNTAIYFRAGIAALMRMLGKMASPLFDGALLFSGLFLVKLYWEYYVKYIEGGTYPDAYLYINVPAYMLIWLFTLFLSGGYDNNATPGRIVRGMVWGTFIIAAVYGFLPEHLRFSRGMIIAGAALNIALLIGARGFLHFIKYGNIRFGEAPDKRILLVGGVKEITRAQQLLNTLQLGNQLIGFAGNNKNIEHPLLLGNIDELPLIIRNFRINEVIFCADDVPATEIVRLMTLCGKLTDFKIIPPGSDSIIGSNSKNTAGDIYTMEVQMNIHHPQKQRSKRLLDILIATFGIVLSPLLIWFMDNKAGFLNNCFQVLWGRRSWVGYISSSSGISSNGQKLPTLLPGVLHPLSAGTTVTIAPHIAERVNFMYARDYTPAADLMIIKGAWRRLGGMETVM
ncbi:MAG TPA: glycosyltransferase [Chitinophagales bacterium]|nr:glycosyltransferase [Chitinophagales bacterium]HMX03570.1 glycosyltransferase [Chitinophagales bacterium]HMZ88456.1 glycosyltransferase [Chitinophagales bacterium]HNA56817.1 glycosyltransferase [Chitinophagales bacterium]HNE46641.1 glycosyltransferase [Chitinophagales bacterium]